MRPEIPRSVARRLDRLAVRAHAFHRFAHHPLCGAYAGEVIRLGRKVRICRGCTLAIAGILAGALVATALPADSLLAAGAGGLAIAAGYASLRGPRRSKLVTRLLPGAALGVAVDAALRAGAWPLALAAATGALAVLRAYRRRGPERSPCTSCPARAERPCPGFTEMVRRERAFQRVAARLLPVLQDARYDLR